MNSMIVMVNGNHVAVPQTETGCPIVPVEWIETTHLSSPYPVYRSEQQIDWVVSPELLKPSAGIAQMVKQQNEAIDRISTICTNFIEQSRLEVSQLTCSISKMTNAIGNMSSVMGEMLEELASQNQPEENLGEGYLDD